MEDPVEAADRERWFLKQTKLDKSKSSGDGTKSSIVRKRVVSSAQRALGRTSEMDSDAAFTSDGRFIYVLSSQVNDNSKSFLKKLSLFDLDASAEVTFQRVEVPPMFQEASMSKTILIPIPPLEHKEVTD